MIKDQEVKFYKRFIYGYLPVGLLLVFCAIGVVTASSNYLSYFSMAQMEKWSCEGKISRPEDWESVHQSLSMASHLSPLDADIQLSLGDLYAWKANGNALWSESAHDSRLVAIGYYRNAIDLRPTSAAAWIKLTQAMLLNKQVNDTMFQALENGYRYGKTMPELKEKLIWLSLGIWPSLSDSLKQQTRDLVKTLIGDKNKFRKILMLSMRFRWLDELQTLLTTSEQERFFELVRKNPEIISGEVKNMFGAEQQLVCN